MPKPECRNPKEIRNPKLETAPLGTWPEVVPFAVRFGEKMASRPRPAFRPSDFGFGPCSSSAELIKHPCVGLHEADQVFRLEHAQRTHVRPRLGETVRLVRSAQRRVQQHRLRVPRMAPD